MNLSAAVMLDRESGVRPVRVEYDADMKSTNPNKLFKAIDPNIAVGDLVIVQTHTRHGFTIAKVTEIDFPIDFANTGDQWGWVAQKFEKPSFDRILEIEKTVTEAVARAQENKMRKELIEAQGLGDVSFASFRNVVQAAPSGAALTAPPAPPPQSAPQSAPAAEPEVKEVPYEPPTMR